jgi:uncharacterized protein (DUF1499 family)
MEIAFTLIAFLVLVCLLGTTYHAARRYALWGALISIVAGAAIYFLTPEFGRRLKTGFETNMASTSPTPQFPELRTRTYATSPQEVLKATEDTIRSMPNWTLVSSDPLTGTIHAEKVFLMFTNDVIVHLTPDAAKTQVDVQSQSRVGKGDFGENRRHIAQLLWGLDQKLSH